MKFEKRLLDRWEKPAPMTGGYYIMSFPIKKGRKIVGEGCTFCGSLVKVNDDGTAEDCLCPKARAAKEYNNDKVGKVILVG